MLTLELVLIESFHIALMVLGEKEFICTTTCLDKIQWLTTVKEETLKD